MAPDALSFLCCSADFAKKMKAAVEVVEFLAHATYKRCSPALVLTVTLVPTGSGDPQTIEFDILADSMTENLRGRVCEDLEGQPMKKVKIKDWVLKEGTFELMLSFFTGKGLQRKLTLPRRGTQLPAGTILMQTLLSDHMLCVLPEALDAVPPMMYGQVFGRVKEEHLDALVSLLRDNEEATWTDVEIREEDEDEEESDESVESDESSE